MDIKEDWLLWFIIFFDKKTADSGIKSMPQNKQLAEELHKPIIKKFKKRKVYSTFKDNIWGADLAGMQLISKFNIYIIDIFSKYAWVVPLKDKKGKSIANAFQSILKKSSRKPNKSKAVSFITILFKKCLQDNIVLYSTHNGEKTVVAERFMRTLKNKIYKYMTSISKNVYIEKLDHIANDYNNTYHRTIKMKPGDVKDNTYINTGKEYNDKDPKSKICDHVRISKYKNILTKTL